MRTVRLLCASIGQLLQLVQLVDCFAQDYYYN
jgi:hypothetical protein